jgi:hypothetical protein
MLVWFDSIWLKLVKEKLSIIKILKQTQYINYTI